MAATITVVCPHCNNRMRASAEYIGRKGRCPVCKALVEITAQGEESLVSVQPATGRTVRAAAKPALSTTDVNTWIAGACGLIGAVLFYLIAFPLQNTYFGELFVKRGFIPPVTVMVTFWGYAALVMKYIAVRRQQSYAELELELIPLDIGLQITPANVDQFLEHLARGPSTQRGSILGRRLNGALEHFKSRNSVPEVQEFLATQAEIDASGVESGYTLLRSFIWVVPILGFIGTVVGISAAVNGLSGTLNSGGQIMDGLNLVTQGLATAFDTTFVALVMAITLLFPTEALRKIEYRMLDRIEAFANESLLRRMTDNQQAMDPERMPEIVRNTLQAAFQEHQRWLAQWQSQVAELGRVVGADFEQAVDRAQQRIERSSSAQSERLQDTTRLLQDVFQQLAGVTESWHRSQQELAQRSEELRASLTQLHGSLAATIEVSGQMLEQQRRAWEKQENNDLVSGILGLRQQIGKLADRIDGASRVEALSLAPDDGTLPTESMVLPDRKKSGGMFGFLRGK